MKTTQEETLLIDAQILPITLGFFLESAATMVKNGDDFFNKFQILDMRTPLIETFFYLQDIDVSDVNRAIKDVDSLTLEQFLTLAHYTNPERESVAS